MSGASESTFSAISSPSSIPGLTAPLPGSLLHSTISMQHLLEIIFNKLLPLFSVDCAVVLIYNEEITHIIEAFTATFQGDTEEMDARVISTVSALNPLQKNIADFSFPVIKTAEEWMAEENQNHCPINGEALYQYHCYLPLETHNQVLGTLELHNSSRALHADCLTFCSSIADMLSDLIYLQRKQAPSSGKPAAKELPADAVPLLKLNEALGRVTGIAALNEFVTAAALIFPSAYQKIKTELDQIYADKIRLEEETLYLPEQTSAVSNYPEIIGAGAGMHKVFALMDQVAASESTVLILGETGTGKELIARAIHQGSVKKDQTMIKVNCAAIPANLIESELFGHEKGAFTGATDLRIGKFEMADQSTLFLDEIGELPLDLQVKLLRVLQEKEIERVGGKSVIKTDVRIISATNRDLLTEVEQGRFRRDLYYRLNVFPISLPPLRERTEDIPVLAAYFLTKYSKQQTSFTQGAIKKMSNYNWPGNVREMEHLIEREILLSTKPVISNIHLPVKAKTIRDEGGTPQKIKTIHENERDHIFAVLQFCQGRISGPEGAAKLLGIPATTLNSKIKRLGLNKKHF